MWVLATSSNVRLFQQIKSQNNSTFQSKKKMLSLHVLIVLIVLLVLLVSTVYSSSKESSYAALKRKQQERKAQAQQKQSEQDQQQKDRISFEERRRRQQELENIVYYDAPTFVKPVLPTLRAEDRILFLGHSNTLYASLFDFGFIPLFQQEIEKIYPNIVIGSIATTTEEKFVLHDANDDLQRLAIDDFNPSKIFFVVGSDFIRDYFPVVDTSMTPEMIKTANTEAFRSLQQRLQAYFAFFTRNPNIETVVIPLFVYGEHFDLSNKYDVFFEDCFGMIQKLLLHFDGKISMVDNFLLDVYKHWETVNWDNHDHSILTHDGEVLNEEGHKFVAKELLEVFQIPHSLKLQQYPHAVLPSSEGLLDENGQILAKSEADEEDSQDFLVRIHNQRTEQQQMLAVAKQMMSLHSETDFEEDF